MLDEQVLLDELAKVSATLREGTDKLAAAEAQIAAKDEEGRQLKGQVYRDSAWVSAADRWPVTHPAHTTGWGREATQIMMNMLTRGT